MTTLHQIEPADLGLPSKFSTWRPSQFESITAICETDKRFAALSSPTGSGKSLSAVASAILMGVRTVILTSTKALQKQYLDDFAPCGMVEVKGRVNYSCVKGDFTCSEGRLLGCRDTGCTYQTDRTKFLESTLSITNCAYFLTCMMHGEGMGEIGLLIIDEAHDVLSELSSSLEIKLDHHRSEKFYRATDCTAQPFGKSIEHWSAWAGKVVPKLKAHFAALKSQGHMKHLSELDRLIADLGRVCTIPSTWILDESVPGETTFAPLWPTDYAESNLFCNIKKVFLTSATIVRKNLTLLNIPDSNSLFVENKYTFNPNLSPVYLMGQSRIDHKTTYGQWEELLGCMDYFISRRLDRKGIIHTVSYDKQQFIVSKSEHQQHMLSPRGNALLPTIKQFKESPPPAILVHPAVTTGYDFAYSQCEFQCIIKVPFIDTRSPIMSARVKADPEYAISITAQILTQTVGRPMRAEDDQNENAIFDAHANWLLREPKYNSQGRNVGGYRHLFPSWFAQLIRYPNGQPTPPPALMRRNQ